MTDPHAAPDPPRLALTVEQVLGSAPDPFFALDTDWRVLYINGAGERVLEQTAGALVGQRLWEVFPEAVGSTFHREYTRAVRDGVTVTFTEFYAPLNRWFAVQAVPLPTGLAAFFHDVTAVKEAERREARLAAVHSALRRVATVVAADGGQQAGPERAFSLVAEQSAELVEATGSWLVRFADYGYEVLASTVPPGRGRPATGDRVRIRPGTEIARVRDGEALTVSGPTKGRLEELDLRSAVFVPVRLAGHVWGCLAVAWESERPDAAACEPLLRDFSDLIAVALDNAAARSELARQAADDPLTGLANLRTLHRELDARVPDAADHGRDLCLALVDIDHFKAVNDGHGHDVGDAVLQRVGLRLAAACREHDVAARIGGDEFALVLDGCDVATATALAERVRADVAAEGGDGGLPAVTVSIGVCAWEPGFDREALQRRADDALYWAKLHGRDAVWAYNADLMDVGDAQGRAAALRRSGTPIDPREVEEGLRSAKAFWQSALDGLSKEIAILDERGRIIAVNASWRRFSAENDGRPAATGVGADYLAACDAAADDPVAREIAHALREIAAGRRDHLEMDYPCDGPGGKRWFTVRANRFGGDRHGRIIVSHQDVTARRTAEDRSAFQATLLDFIAMPVYATDLDDRVTYWNRAAEILNGMSSDEVLGRRIDTLGLIDPSSVDPRDEHAARSAPDLWEGELVGVRPDGRTFPAFVTRAVIRDADGYRTGVIGTVFDMSERDAYERDLQAARDYLHTVTESIADGLVVFDAAGTVTYANPAAHELLRAEGLAGMPVDAALYGDGARPHAADLLVDERAIEDVFRRADGTTLSVEWSAASLDVPDAARRDGSRLDTTGSRVVLFRDVTERRAREERLRREAEGLRWATRLQDALDEERFVLHAQPIVATDTGETVDHELLIRLRDDDGGFIPPGEFLPAAEELGAIVDIDRWVTRQAVRCAAEGMRVHFNLSARTIGDETILEILRSGLADADVDAGRLTVEVTETALLDDCSSAGTFIAQVRAMGCHVALDDFGTGYNGLGRVKELDADIVKIDRQFVGDLLREPASESVVKAILAFADDLGLGIIAEGVEDEETARRLCELGVPHAQGFHFGRPGPVAWTSPVAPGPGD